MASAVVYRPEDPVIIWAEVTTVHCITSRVCLKPRPTVIYYNMLSLSAWNTSISAHFTAHRLKTRCVLSNSNKLFLGG